MKILPGRLEDPSEELAKKIICNPVFFPVIFFFHVLVWLFWLKHISFLYALYILNWNTNVWIPSQLFSYLLVFSGNHIGAKTRILSKKKSRVENLNFQNSPWLSQNSHLAFWKIRSLSNFPPENSVLSKSADEFLRHKTAVHFCRDTVCHTGWSWWFALWLWKALRKKKPWEVSLFVQLCSVVVERLCDYFNVDFNGLWKSCPVISKTLGRVTLDSFSVNWVIISEPTLSN